MPHYCRGRFGSLSPSKFFLALTEKAWEDETSAIPSLSSYVQKFTTLETRRGLEDPNCFWDGYWGGAGQLLANLFFSLTPVTVPEVFANVNSVQFPSRFLREDLR